LTIVEAGIWGLVAADAGAAMTASAAQAAPASNRSFIVKTFNISGSCEPT
jgi:hypothetical protein